MLKLIAAAFLALGFFLQAGAVLAVPPRAQDYYSQPPLLVGSTKPAVLMVVSKSMDMFAPAYAAPADVDGDGRMDVGFNPAVVYTGIFDPHSCYTYTTMLKSQENRNNDDSKNYAKTGDWGSLKPDVTRGHFVRLGPAVSDKADAPGRYPDANRLATEIATGHSDPSLARPGFRAPRSATGLCVGIDKVTGGDALDQSGKNKATGSVSGLVNMWSGNWLNWLTSSRIDVMRQVLYGGKRVVDKPEETYLTVEWIPENAGVWTYDDFTKYFWLDYNEGSPYYDSSNYTPVNPDRWGGHYRRLHSYGRTMNRMYIIDSIWFMRQKEDVTNHEGFRSFNAYHVPKFRNQHTPLAYVLNSFAEKYKVFDFEVVVQACQPLSRKEVYDYYRLVDRRRVVDKWQPPSKQDDVPSSDLLEKGDYCQRYGAFFKPAGLLQKYAELDQALFGLMTGAFNNLNRWDAGWLRHNVASIRGQINPDGTFKGDARDNIFKMFDSIVEVTGPRLPPLDAQRKKVDAALQSRRSGWADPAPSNFGNPLGEMAYAALMYFAHNSNSPYSYWPEGVLGDVEQVALPRLGPPGAEAWLSPLAAGGGDCLKPVVLILSSTTTDHDGDMIPGSPHGLRKGAPAPHALSLNFFEKDRFANAAGLGRTFSMRDYLAAITKIEGIGGESFYIANLNTGAPGAESRGQVSVQPADPGDTNLCVPRKLGNLADVRGLCPASPQTFGTYAVAAAAYYGNTHAFGDGGANVKTYAVALPSIFPEIKLESRGRVISFSPVAMSVTHPCGRGDGDPRFCLDGGGKPAGVQFLGPVTSSVIQWRADDLGRVYSGAVFMGFTGGLEGGGRDGYQLDAPVRYYFDLVRECRYGEDCWVDQTGEPQGLRQSFRYGENWQNHEGHPNPAEERRFAYDFLNQPKYESRAPAGFKLQNPGSCGSRGARENRISGCGGRPERLMAKRILMDFPDGRYAAAPFKRRREWVYKNWDHAGRPNYILSGERPKNYHIAAYMPRRWSQYPGTFIRPAGELTTYFDLDPALMQSYARATMPDACGAGARLDGGGCRARAEAMRRLPGARLYDDNHSKIDYVADDERDSLFVDRPFADIGYEEVMDVYGYIGEPGRIYKKVTVPEEVDEAVGVAVFVYSLYETIDGSDRSAPVNIGYHTHGGLNYAQSAAENPGRELGDAEGTYIEIQNEHNYMGGDPQTVSNAFGSASPTHRNSGEQFGLMGIAHPLNTPPTCYRAGRANIAEPMSFAAAERDPRTFKNDDNANADYAGPLPVHGVGNKGGSAMSGFLADAQKVRHSEAVPECGSARLPLTSTRLFRFPPAGGRVAGPRYLPDPLWLAAKYGGFDDHNRDGIPDPLEYDVLPGPSGDGIPDNYFYAANLSQLKDKLAEAFERIMAVPLVGTATSASVNSVLGGGVTVRTYYQPSHASQKNPRMAEVSWLGGTYALFVDPWGNMREDTNQNGLLDLDCGFDGDPRGGRDSGGGSKGDFVVEFVDCGTYVYPAGLNVKHCADARDKADLRTMALVYPDQNGANLVRKTPPRARFVSLQDVRTVWNLARNLSKPSARVDVTTPRPYSDLSSDRRRVYFYHEELTPRAPTELKDEHLFEPRQAGRLGPFLLAAGEGEAKKLVEYVLGWDQPGLRPRLTASPWHDLNPGGPVTCRLGDVVNSQPVIVGAPFSNYDYLYGDPSYSRFRARHGARRHLALVGANDGMLHAVNMGFQAPLKNSLNGYRDVSRSYLGKEMWAFIPQSILPHLGWLPRMDYAHSYYLDLTPTVVEIKEGAEWRTVLLGSLRFGGRAIELGGGKYSYSEVFALDITDPEKPPRLMWRFSHPQMGLVVARPTVVRNGALGDKWYALVASGPTYDDYDPVKKVMVPAGGRGRQAYQGHSNQTAKLFVFDANSGPGKDNSAVVTIDSRVPRSFIGSFQVLAPPPSAVTGAGDKVAWTNQLAYFSLNQSAPDDALLCYADKTEADPCLDARVPSDFCPGTDSFSNKGYLDKGAVWRLNMADAAGKPVPARDWQSNFRLFFQAEKPVTASVNTTYDASGNLWVLFGSGRYFANADSQLCEGPGDTAECRLNHVNYLYGVKEPVDSKGGLSFAQVDHRDLVDVSNVLVYEDAGVGALKPDGSVGDLVLGGNNPVGTYEKLRSVIMGKTSPGYKRALKTNTELYVDGEEAASPALALANKSTWWHGLSYEMVVEQPAVAPYGNEGSVMSLATFLPETVACGSVGSSYAYILDTFTGLPRPDFASRGFKSVNTMQDRVVQNKPPGRSVVSDHAAKVAGKSSAAVLVLTGGNEGKTARFEIVNSDGTVTVFKLPAEKVVSGGVVSWRELYDFGLPR
ncbi:MAG: hypothetical protein LBO05_13195 [Deltaproteobacteria bacterium]|jgi:hypothetical protein|nr:hypothetical protein [Deltaproteobacteria bacterium]